MATDKSEWVIGKQLDRQARARGDAPFVQFEDGEPYTFADAQAMSYRAGNGFARVGVEFGDNVAVMMNNCLEWLWCWWGLNRIGAVQVAINTAYRGMFMTHVLVNAGARIGVMDREFLPWLAEVEDSVALMETVFVPGEPLAAGDMPAFKRIEVRHFDELMAAPAEPIDVDVRYSDIGMIMYTSGTTGPSKGVLMPHAHLYLFGYGMQLHLALTEADRYYICMPLFHAQGSLMQTYATLIAGASAVLTKFFRASSWIDDVRKYKATVTNALGVMNDFILRQPAKPTDADNDLRMLCAVPVTADTVEAFRSRFNIAQFSELFGMTECNIPVNRPIDAPAEPGCTGKVWDEYFEVIIADPQTDEELPTGEVGEILIRPKEPFCFMRGYKDMDEHTVSTWRNLWFHSGDAGRMDERGYLWYIDRIKDTIRRRGENISSYEVEAVFLEHAAVAEAAAVAVKADAGGEDEVLVCIVLKPGAARPDPAALLDYCVPRMPYFAVPRYVEFIDEIPKTPSQKIQKNKLRERGLSEATWDRERVGYKVTRHG
ncbi:MAG: AMP-binding protein [Gammaproteobacteria bacterium]|nr:AMP-binding protein [Gammaproteobacteria bacterium]